MNVVCPKCGTRNLRPSHFVWTDAAWLLVLRAPVRCRYCRERFYASILTVREIRREAEERRAREALDTRPSQALELQRQRLKQSR